MRNPCLASIFVGATVMLAMSGSRPAASPHFLRFYETSRSAGQNAHSRRPLPLEALPVYYERLGPAASRQGTAFAVDLRGSWATAGHVTDQCRKIYLLENQRRTPPMPAPTRAAGDDIALLAGGLGAPAALKLARQIPARGATGYHMGFPMGSPGLIGSQLLGATRTVRQSGRAEHVLAWVEQWRSQGPDQPLDGLSGAPVLNADAEVVGIVSMASERRGRILSAMPRALRPLMSEPQVGVDQRYSTPLAGRKNAVARFEQLLNGGVIRQVYCDI